MVRIFLAWWLRQLSALLPRALRPATADGSAPEDISDSVLLALTPTRLGQPPALEAARRRRKRLIPLGRFGLDTTGLAALRAAIGTGRHGPIRLVLPPALLLEQPVTLPLAAERGLASALRWEMDRLTPFTADAVFWTWRITQRDRIRSQLTLRLVLVAKSAVETSVNALAAAGLAPARLEAAGEPARAISLTGPRRSAPRRPALIAGLTLCAGLAIAAIAIPFVRQQAELDRLDARIADLRPQVEIAETLRRRVADRTASADVVAAEAARVGNMLRMLAALTDLIPDDTSLYDLTLRDRIVTFTGQSTQAARLIPALAADPAVRNPVFSAAVTRNEMTHTEAFAIRAEMQP
jgi:general secretion pathway protein L